MKITENDVVETCEVHGFPLDPDQIEVVTAVVNQMFLRRLSDAQIAACALMIKGICMTKPQEYWVANIKARIRFMLSQDETSESGDPT